MSVRPSATWMTAEQHEQEERYTSTFWPLVPFEKLERYAEGLRVSLGVPFTPCRANREKYAQGANAIVIELVFDDDEVWIARLRAPVNVCGDTPSAVNLAREIETEVATMKYVREKTTIPVPTIFGYSTDANNVVGMPFMIMSAVRGQSLEDLGIMHPAIGLEGDLAPIADCYINDLASIVEQLSELRFDMIGSLYFDPSDPTKYVIGPLAEDGIGPFKTAFEYYSACVQIWEDQCLSIPDDTPEEREGRAYVLWLFRLGLSSVSSSLDNNGPFLLAHYDIHKRNALCDKDGHVVGLIDWGSAAALPMETFVAQCWECCTDTKAHRQRWDLPAHRRFGEALTRLEKGMSSFPSGRTLAQVHSSSAACLCGPCKRLLEGPDRCQEYPYAEMLIHLVLGTLPVDVAGSKNSPLFKEWYATTLRRVQSIQPHVTSTDTAS